jgi:hypothetical protein
MPRVTEDGDAGRFWTDFLKGEIVEIEVVFSREEVRNLAEREYVRLFGSAPDGYEFQAWDHYGGMKVQLRKKAEIPAPVTETPEPAPAVGEI